MNQLFSFFLSVSLFLSCTDDQVADEVTLSPIDYNETWSEESHSNDAETDYDMVFPQDKVLRIDITLESSNWSAMQSDLSANMGSSTGGRGGGGGTSDTDFTPVWVPCTLMFEGKEWMKVGLRYKGNSSLKSVYNSNINKYSFKLDFDEFEDDYPEIKNQRFYGFKQLNLNNNFEDNSLLHEKVAPELFREFGLVAPQTAFVALYIDMGNGAQYFGLYTLVEEVDDTVLEDQYEMSTGNLYKPEGDGATFASGTFNTEHMYKKTNEDAADYSDVETLYTNINSTERFTDEDGWQDNLETIFDVNVFLKWLAANTIIQNWDTYGTMSHNYYLYNNPLTNKIEWIPWDNNEAFSEGKQGGGADINLSNISSSWPLISNIAELPYYRELYNDYLEEFVSEVFKESRMLEIYDGYAALIADYVEAEELNYTFTSVQQFNSEIEYLKQHVVSRTQVVENYLETQD